MQAAADFQIERLSGHGYSYDVLETPCVAGCPHRYRIDTAHPDYHRVFDALKAGDRSVIHCYHHQRY